ncbi:MAG TPA: thermonuclease family protein [Coleofasciculaceae cyanobacterium]|jgi:micrococcal nuclease
MSRKKLRLKFPKAITSLLLLLILGGISSQFLAQTSQGYQPLQSAKVTRIVDGDTLDINLSGCRLPLIDKPQQCRIQLACIDTPEIGQEPFFKNAKERIEELLPLGTTVRVRDTGDSSGDRIVAEIFLDKQSINLQMVREGNAVVYCKHLNSCAGSRNSYLNAESAAKREGLGVWNPRQPWTQSRELHPCSR